MRTFENKLDEWLKNIPDYDEVEQAYALQSQVRAEIIRTKRAIERTDEEAIEGLKPRSNEARIARQKATADLRDRLAELEAALCESEGQVKTLEYKKGMFSTASHVKRMRDII